MKVDSVNVNFIIYIISSRTKHEPFNSFGSHASFLYGNSIYFNEPTLFLSVRIKRYTKLSYSKPDYF